MKVTGKPTCGFPEAVIEAVGSASTVMVIVFDGAVIVVVPSVEVMPAVAVTIAVLVVERTEVAIPF